MSRTKAVIAVAGWEDRFSLGAERDLLAYGPETFLVVVFDEYQQQTASGREYVKKACSIHGVRYVEIKVERSSPVNLWMKLHGIFAGEIYRDTQVVVDITTMPREVIWCTFKAFQSVAARVSYVYYQPETYAAGWVTRDTEQPRLVYQSSGVSDFGRDTCLVLVSGFDIDRTFQLIQFFEPAVTLIGAQVGEQFSNRSHNVERHKILLRPSSKAIYFDIDAYSADHGLQALESATVNVREKYNVVLASLGPKLSAVALYHLQQKYQSLALAYAPSRQLNPEYSKGIGEPSTGMLLSYASSSIDI